MVYDIIEWIRTHRKQTALLVLCGLVLVVTYNGYLYIDRRGKTAVYIDVFPSNAEIAIKGAKTVKEGTAYLPPGTYSYTISREGYVSRTATLYVESDKPASIYASLAKEKGEYTSREQREIQRIEQKGGRESYANTQRFKAQYPITNYLPIKDAYYSIGYLVDEKGDNFHITVYTESPRYRAEALKRIRSIGEDPSDYRIEFKDFKNPLTGGNK